MEELDRAYQVHRLWEAKDRDQLLQDIGPTVRAVATNGSLGASSRLINALPSLEIIACFGVGVDAIDLQTASARGIAVTNTPDVLTDDVADMAVGLLLAASRQLVKGDQYVRSGNWPSGELPLTNRVSGKRAGIFGLGRVGRAVASRLLAFGMEIGYYSRSRQTGLPYHYSESLVDLARLSDFLVITAAGGPSTAKAVNAEVLAALGPNGILVNVARGSIVDEAALIDALERNQIRGAGLDVFLNEPRINPALFTFPQVVLQPHHGSGTIETRTAMGKLLLDNLAAHFSSKPLLTPVGT
jgi:D-3-phosphoglycerate dehydrogenase